MKFFLKPLICTLALSFTAQNLMAEALSPEQKVLVDKYVEEVKTWAANPAIVDAVKNQNSAPSADVKSMDQKKWDSLTILDPVMKNFTKNPAADFLKSKKGDVVSEAFVSSADGTKVAFLSKTTGWTHKGKGKHDKPMEGKVWIGDIEVDESSGAKQVQVAVPVLDGGKSVGSLVVGLNIVKLK